MAAFLLTEASASRCAHGGYGQPVAPSPRVRINGRAVVPLASPYTISGCTLPPDRGGPCVSATFVTAATRVASGGQPLLLASSQAVCAPTGTPLVVTAAQTRVNGT